MADSQAFHDVLLAQKGVELEVASWVPDGVKAPTQVHLIVHVREDRKQAPGVPRFDVVLRMKSREAVDAIITLLGDARRRDEVFGHEPG